MVLQNRYLKFILYTTLFMSFVVSLNVAVRRVWFEAQNNRVEVAMSYREIQRLSVWQGGGDTHEILKRFKDTAHITSITLEEDTLADFVEAGKVSVLKGSEVMNMYRVGHVNRYLLTHLYKQVKVEPEHFYLIIDQKDDYNRIKDFLSSEFGKDNVRKIGNHNILEVVDEREDLFGIGLGISKERITAVTDLGLNPIIRLKNSNRLSKAVIQQKLLSFLNDVPQATLIFQGQSVLGFPNLLPYIEDKVRDHNLKIGMVEFANQLGGKTLAKSLPSYVLRVHSIPQEEMAYMPREKAVTRYLRATKERGIKVLVIHPFFQVYQEQNILDFNVDYVQEITEKIRSYGFEIAPVKNLPIHSYVAAKKWELFVLSLGLLTTLLFLFNYYLPLSIKRCLLVYGGFGATFYAFYLFKGLFIWNQFMAMLTAIIFPTLAIVSQFPQEQDMTLLQDRKFPAVLYLLKLLGICLIGAFLIIGFLSDIQYVFGIERFWGVKASYLVPLILIGLFFFLRPHRISSMFFVLKRLYYAPVRTAVLVAIILCVSIIAILLLRSGNYIVMPKLFFEDKIRELLEQFLWVRPRTKEFLIGYPFLLFAFIKVDRVISRNWLWFFNVIGATALISTVNSFCHVHTPLNISLYRTCLGLVLGIGVGLIYILVYKCLRKIYEKVLT